MLEKLFKFRISSSIFLSGFTAVIKSSLYKTSQTLLKPIPKFSQNVLNTAPLNPMFEGRLNVYNQWNGGYCLRLQIVNTGDVASKPQGFRFSMTDSTAISPSWGGMLQRGNGFVEVAIPSWLDAVQLGG